MAKVTYSQSHYQTFRSAALDEPITRARNNGRMIGEDTIDVYDSSINFDYVCRFLMAKYPDFIPIPGTDRRAGILHAGDMGLSVELVPYTDYYVYPVIDAKDIVINPKWEYHRKEYYPGYNHPTNPYKAVKGTTPRKKWAVGRNDSRHKTGEEFLGELNAGLPLYGSRDERCWTLNENKRRLLIPVSDGAQQPNTLYPVDMRSMVTTHWDNAVDYIHHNYRPEAWWTDDWDRHNKIHTAIPDAALFSPFYCTDDGSNIFRLAMTLTNITTRACGPVYNYDNKWGRGWEEVIFDFHAPRYIYPCDIERYKKPNALYGIPGSPKVWVPSIRPIMSASLRSEYTSGRRSYPPLHSYEARNYICLGIEAVLFTDSLSTLCTLTDAARQKLASAGTNASWCLCSISYSRVEKPQSKWVPRSTPLITEDKLTRHKKQVLDRVVYAAEQLGTVTEKGTYLVTIDGEKYALPATYSSKQDEPTVYFSITHHIQSIESTTKWTSKNWTPTPDTTTMSKALAGFTELTDDSSPEQIMKDIIIALKHIYIVDYDDGYRVNPDITGSKYIHDNYLNEAPVAKVIKLTTEGNVDHYTIYGTYRNGRGLKGLDDWAKEDSFIGYITITRGIVQRGFSYDD